MDGSCLGKSDMNPAGADSTRETAMDKMDKDRLVLPANIKHIPEAETET
jgi:hypothetical protein